jgi:hypothetical protein
MSKKQVACMPLDNNDNNDNSEDVSSDIGNSMAIPKRQRLDAINPTAIP